MEDLNLPGLPWPLPEEDPPPFRPGLISARPCAPDSEFLASFTVDDQLHEPRWQVAGYVKMEGSRIVIAEMTIRRSPSGSIHLPAGGVNRAVLSQIKTSELLRGIRWALADFRRRVEISYGHGGVSDAFRTHVQQVAAKAAAESPAVPGRRGRDHTLYLDLAVRYLDLQAELLRWGADTPHGNHRPPGSRTVAHRCCERKEPVVKRHSQVTTPEMRPARILDLRRGRTCRRREGTEVARRGSQS